jgi:asparagine synthase (glutamine-hydrolysing)
MAPVGGPARAPAEPPAARAPALRPEEIAYGMPIGLEHRPPLPVGDGSGSPRQALEEVLAGALARPPCLVSFSGGRDSSALLAVATAVARRHGLALPVPATMVFPGSPASEEGRWQTAVLDHLALPDRILIPVGDELDAVGPVASAALTRHGLLWPFNAHFHVPVFEHAAGGTVVTGFGGDELALSSSSARAERVLARRLHPGWTDVLRVGLALSPRPVRTAVHWHRARADLADRPWVTTRGRRLLSRQLAIADGQIPLGWEAVLRRIVWRSRYFTVCTGSLAALGAAVDVAVVHPFVDPQVLDALARAGGFAGLGNRTALTDRLFGDVLPAEVVRRQSKASFTDPLWTATAREFAATWSGGGIDTTLVDADALRRVWAGDQPNLLTITLLQQAWLHDHPGSAIAGRGAGTAGPIGTRS